MIPGNNIYLSQVTKLLCQSDLSSKPDFLRYRNKLDVSMSNLVYRKGKKICLGLFIDYYYFINSIFWLRGYAAFQYKLEMSIGLAALQGFQSVSWTIHFGSWQ
jgi:hypothetical protein